MKPQQLLHQLAIKKLKSNAEPPWDIDALSNESEDTPDIMSAAKMNVLFSDERVARWTLGTNFERLQFSMRQLERSYVFGNGKLAKVAELGGGTGLLGMYLIANGLCNQCEIYDHAKNALKIGENWAERLGLLRLSFHNCSYADLARSMFFEDCDFVFSEHGVDLSMYPDTWDEQDDIAKKCHLFYQKTYNDLAQGMYHRLKPDGIGLISCGVASPWALTFLCQALQTAGFTIDWRRTSYRETVQIYVVKGGIDMFNSASESALALLADSTPPRDMKGHEAYVYSRIFQDAKNYFDLHFDTGHGTEGKISIYGKAGFAFQFERCTNGQLAGKLLGAGRIHEMASQSLQVPLENGFKIQKKYINPAVEALMKLES